MPKKPALTLVGDLLYGLDDNGVATCWEAATGNVVWNERVGGNYSASPIAADGRLCFCSEEGRRWSSRSDASSKLAENTLEDGFMGSPAVSGQSLLLRTRTALYRIQNERNPNPSLHPAVRFPWLRLVVTLACAGSSMDS